MDAAKRPEFGPLSRYDHDIFKVQRSKTSTLTNLYRIFRSVMFTLLTSYDICLLSKMSTTKDNGNLIRIPSYTVDAADPLEENVNLCC